MNIFCFLLAFASFGAGAAFYTGYALRYIKAWHSMTDAEKAQIKILPLCRNASVVFFSAGLILLLAAANPCFLAHAFAPCMALWVIGTGADIFYIGKSGKYVNE